MCRRRPSRYLMIARRHSLTLQRIHRIGQTRPTHIDILVTQGTFEEDIVRREASMRSQLMEQSYTRALIEVSGTWHGDACTVARFRFVRKDAS